MHLKKIYGLIFIMQIVFINSGIAQNGINLNNFSKIKSKIESLNKKAFTDIRFSAGTGIGVLYGNKYTSINIQSLLNKNFTITTGLDYYFIKNAEERELKNFISPTLLILYNAGTDVQGNEILFGGGISYQDIDQIKPLISVKGNLYLKNNFYLGLEIRQPFIDTILESTSSVGIFVSPYIGINLFYKLTK